MIVRYSAALVLAALVVLASGCATASTPVAGSPSSREVAVLYVPPPGAAFSQGMPGAVEMPAASGSIANDAIWQRSIASHAHLIAHRSNLSATLGDTKSAMRSTKWYTRQASPSDALAWLQQNVKATPIPGTALIELSIAGEIDRDEAAVIVNEIAIHYLVRDRNRESDKLVEQIDLFTNLKVRYEQAARVSRSETANLGATLQLDGMGRPGFIGQKEQELQLLTAERLKATAAAAEAEIAYKQVKQDVDQGGVPGVVELQLNQDWEITTQRERLKNRTGPLGLAPNPNPRAEIEAEVKELEKRTAEKRALLTDAYVANLQARWNGAKSSVEAITRQIDELKNQLAELSVRVAEYVTKRDEEAAYRELARRYAEQVDRLNVLRQRWDPGQIVFAARAGAKL